MGRISEFFGEIKILSVYSGISSLTLLCSFVICRFVHGASWDNFRVLEMYKLSHKERQKIYTFRRQKRISDFLNKSANDEDLHILMDKNKFNTAFSRFIKRDWYDSTVSDKQQFTEFLYRNNKFLMKPILSSQGKGIELYQSSEVDIDSFYNAISSQEVILEGFIEQHSELASINPSSVNTIRLITARYGNNVHVIAGGAIRCGGKDSFVDNFHNGGCAYPIDISTGIVDGPGLTLGSKEKIYRHPSTGKEMLGFHIPNWELILDMVYSAAMIMDNVGYIGWDLAVLEDGCEIIEANVNYPGTNIVQLDGFTAYENIKVFLDGCGVKI